MENKKAPTFMFSIIAIILGWILFKQFDFKTLSFEKPLLALVYGIVFVCSIYVLIRNKKNKAEK